VIVTESTTVRKRWRLGVVVVVLLLGAVAVAMPASMARGQEVISLDPSSLLPGDDELPTGFEHQVQYDMALEEAGVLRIYRFYTRGEPEVPSDDHASILLGVTVTESTDAATKEFHDAIAAWSRMGYGLASFDEELGDESVAGWDGMAAGEYPKRAALIVTRFGRIIVMAQWTDDPNAVTLDSLVEVARLIEGRAYDAQATT
jgi:hypothetical protein